MADHRGSDGLVSFTQVQQKRAAISGANDHGTKGELLDAEEYDILSKLKSAKMTYRQEFDQLKDLKAKLE
eukprot:scaffold236999_cov36-Prasinocladus_malaysianus.AAC.1